MSSQRYLDYIGTILSSFCALHCLAMPFVIALLPAIGLTWLAESSFGIFAVVITGVIAIWATVSGYKNHKNCWPLFWMGIGITVLLLSEFWLHNMIVQKEVKFGNITRLVYAKGHPFHNYVSAFGGFIVVIGHLVNKYLCSRCTNTNCNKHE